MKKVILVIFLVLFGAFIRVIADEVKVTMKNGMVITGDLKEFLPMDRVTVVVAGIETTIPVTKVVSVEQHNILQQLSTEGNKEDDTKLKYGEYSFTDTTSYPDSFVLKICDQELTMILVRGGWFNMGYDDRHSWALSSEPVHHVTLSSFYISQDLLSMETAKALGFVKGEKDGPWWNSNEWNKAHDFIDSLQSTTHMKLRLPTEAEWEYAAITHLADDIFGNTTNFEWCQDISAPYSEKSQLNPKGALKGSEHIRRSYNIPLHTRTLEPNITKWCRFINNNHYKSLIKGKNLATYYPSCVRIAISADEI